MFFSQLAQDLGGIKNPLYALHDELRTQGRSITDLVRGNVNEHGIIFPPAALDEILRSAAEDARSYRPDSFGQMAARQAIANYYGPVKIRPDQILITPGTSVSYWYCFKLLAEPGDQILCPRPSYPLFDYIAKLCGIELNSYRLSESQEWAIDLEHLEHQIVKRTRAIVVISPHNPTGMVADAKQLQTLAEIAVRHNLPLISDEVFSEFLFGPSSLPRPSETDAPLVFTLNGLSKMFALPGMKVGWMAVTGSGELVRRAMAALEIISDTFLPVNEIAQFAVPAIFERGRDFLRDYAGWIGRCRSAAMNALASGSFSPPRGGFYLTVPVEGDEEKVAVALLKREGILVHPGYFYDIEPNHLVMTFVHDLDRIPETFMKIEHARSPDFAA
jgi:aspartate/methionine/tyrosine aminotransferase